MKTRTLFAAFVLTAITAAYALPAKAASTPDFIQNAAVGGMFEVQSSQLALQKSQNDGVKSFAQEMVTDHTQANAQLKDAVVAENAGAQPPAALDTKHQKMMDSLNHKTGADFDKLYIDDQVKAHKETIKLFKDYAKNGDDAGLKQFATQTLPTLHKHKQDIEQLKQNYQAAR